MAKPHINLTLNYIGVPKVRLSYSPLHGWQIAHESKAFFIAMGWNAAFHIMVFKRRLNKLNGVGY